MSDDIKVGDKIRAVFESEVVAVDDDGTIRLRDGESDDNFYFHPEDENVAAFYVVKKAKPKVVTFKPGDRLRRKWDYLPYEVTLADEGFLQHVPSSTSVAYYKYASSSNRDWFNSENFDKVELHEAPL